MKTNLKNRLFNRSSILGASLPAIFTVVLATSAHAATAIWDGAAGSGNTNWTLDNWSGGGGALGVPLANDILQFSGNGGTAGPTTVNNFTAATQFNGINFTNNGTGGVTNTAFILSGSGNSITLGGNIVATSSTAAIQDTISNDLLIGATRVVTAAGNHTIALTGAITITGTGSVLNFNNAAALSGAGGAINLNSLNATITYSNTTTTSSLALSRAINANNGAHLSNTSTDVAATLTYNGTFTGTNNTFVLNGTNTGANDFQSAFSAGTTTILLKAGTGSWTVSGLMSSTNGTGVSGVTGNLTLSNNANSYTGQTIVTNGTLNIATIADWGTNSAVGKGTSGVALQLGKDATSGILNYTGTGSSSNRRIQIGAGGTGAHTGSATIQNNGNNGGTGLKFTAATSSTAFNTPVASTTANRTLTLGGTNTDANEIQGKIADNTATTGLVAVTKADAGTWTLSGANTYTGTTSVNAGILKLTNTLSGTGAMTVDSNGILEITKLGFSSNSALAITVNGTLQLGATDTFGNASTVSTPSITVNTGGTLKCTGNNIFNTLWNLNLNGGTLNTTGGLTSQWGAFALAGNVTVTGNQTSTISNTGGTNPYISLKTAGTTFNVVDTTGNLNVSSAIKNGNPGDVSAGFVTSSLIKTGAGTMTLSVANTFTGNTIVNQGALTLTNNFALQNSAVDTSGAGTITLSGTNTPTLGGLIGSKNLDSVITSGTSGVTSLALNPGSGVTYSGVIANLGAGAMALTKSGAGTQTLSGTNSYTGDTLVDKGILSLGNGTANTSLADTAGVVIGTDSTAVLNLNYTGTDTVASLTINGVAKAPGSVVTSADPSGRITGAGTLTVGVAAPTYSSWASTNAGGQTANFDWDNDGVANGVEFFMNAAAGFTANPTLNGSNVITWSNGGNIPSSAYGTQYVIQTSGDLVNWTDVPSGSLTTNTNGPGGSLTYTLTGAAPRFVRLKVTPN